MAPDNESDRSDRLSGLERLLGAPGLARLATARVAVIGIGGVGSWTAEALARSGLGALRLVDGDDVCVTNVNRQLVALDGAVGRPKVRVMAERAALIDPSLAVEAVPAFLGEANLDAVLDGVDLVVDCIDSARLKADLVARAQAAGRGVVVVGGAGGRRDPTAVRAVDLGLAAGDPLLRRTRQELRRRHGYPRGGAGRPAPLGVRCITSLEAPVYPWRDGTCRATPEPDAPLALDCASGFGTAAFGTGAMGLAAAAEAVRLLLERPPPSAEDARGGRVDVGGEQLDGDAAERGERGVGAR